MSLMIHGRKKPISHAATITVVFFSCATENT